MADDWWSDLVAPAGGGKTGLSGTEQADLAKARESNQQGRNVFPALSRIYDVAKRYPGGNPNAVLAKGMLGIGSNEPQYQDYRLFQKLAMRAAISKAKLLGTNPSNKDMENTLLAAADPVSRFGVNQDVIGLDFSDASRKYFENSFKQRWAAKTGSLSGRDKQGHSYPEALADAMRRPDVQTLMKPPWERQQQGGGPAKIKGDDDYNRLPSGAEFIAPDGSHRRKP